MHFDLDKLRRENILKELWDDTKIVQEKAKFVKEIKNEFGGSEKKEAFIDMLLEKYDFYSHNSDLLILEEMNIKNIFLVHIHNTRTSGYGLIDFSNCKEILPCKSSIIKPIENNLTNENLYFVDGALYDLQHQKFLTEKIFRSMRFICDDRIIANCKDEYCYCLDSKGNKIIPDKARQIKLKDFGIFVTLEKVKPIEYPSDFGPYNRYYYGIFDINGNRLVPDLFENVTINKDGCIIADDNVFDIHGNRIVGKVDSEQLIMDKIKQILSVEGTVNDKLVSIKELITSSGDKIESLPKTSQGISKPKSKTQN